MGRTPGDPEKVSEAKRRANKRNAQLPRSTAAVQELREIAKRVLGPKMAGPAFERIGRILDGLEGDYEQFRWACEFVANRIGLPAVTHQQIGVSGFAIQLGSFDAAATGLSALGWPESGRTNAVDVGPVVDGHDAVSSNGSGH